MKPSNRKVIHVSVLESDPVRFLGLRSLFASEPDIKLRDMKLAAALDNPTDDLILMTADRGPVFFAAMSSLKAARPQVRIIVTGPGNGDEDILRAMVAGAKGYVSEESTPAEFKKAIREVAAGSVWVPRRVMATFIERATTYAPRLKPRGAPKISAREREVLRLLVAGCSNREIGKELGIIERTVKSHVAGLLRKLGVTNRIALTVHAVTNSLLPPEK